MFEIRTGVWQENLVGTLATLPSDSLDYEDNNSNILKYN